MMLGAAWYSVCICWKSLAEFAKQFMPGEMLKHASDIFICGRSTEDFL
jgi:hypothetical protein